MFYYPIIKEELIALFKKYLYRIIKFTYHEKKKKIFI